jgi:hypothetical protein
MVIWHSTIIHIVPVIVTVVVHHAVVMVVVGLLGM